MNKATDDGRTPLAIAAYQGHEAVGGGWWRRGGGNKATDDGTTPSDVETGHEAVVRGLVEAGDVNKATDDGTTPRISPRPVTGGGAGAGGGGGGRNKAMDDGRDPAVRAARGGPRGGRLCWGWWRRWGRGTRRQ